jgi:hypothetical protein
MKILPQALQPLAEYKQFILWHLEKDGSGGYKRVPTNPWSGYRHDAYDPHIWTDAVSALKQAEKYGPRYGISFVLSSSDPFFCIDIDDCLLPDRSGWSATALEVLAQLPGAAVEVSGSGTGLHIFGSGICPPHGCKNTPLKIELYTEKRAIALTGVGSVGSAATDFSARLPAIVTRYFNRTAATGPTSFDDWTTTPVDAWDGYTDDAQLIERALQSRSIASVCGNRCDFKALWTRDVDALSIAYPDAKGRREYDYSSADAALAQHLAFWTGNNCERIRRLMLQSALVRDKYSISNYLSLTIRTAVSRQIEFHSLHRARIDPTGGVATLAAPPANPAPSTPAMSPCMTPTNPISPPTVAPVTGVSAVPPGSMPANPTAPIRVSGYQYLAVNAQEEFFKGCVYIQDMHRIFTPSGDFLKQEQFNATYGGYVFPLDDTGEKTTRKAWEAFTESQVYRFPKAQGTCFRPGLPPGAIIKEEGRILVNTYTPIEVRRLKGDVAPFLELLAKILPDENDRTILLSYMAACVQYKGVKFQWAPLLQGVEGNGKTLFTRCVAYAVGKRYTHYPKALDLDNKFNGWLLNKLFIGVEDIYVPERRTEILETLKPMITGGDGLEIQFKGADQITADIVANFIFNTNHPDAIKKTSSDRRFAVFYTAQQVEGDLKKYGMGGSYFPRLYEWLRADGYAIVAEFLNTYPIPPQYNPAGECHRAPETSSTRDALISSLGRVEQEIIEAVEECQPGFCGGWISSVAVDRVLKNTRSSTIIPQNKRREMLRSLGYDWHPGLPCGRVNNPLLTDEGKRPRLFIKKGHIHQNLQGPAEIARVYQEAQLGAGAP